jgi:type II restriction enzyme
LDLEDDIEGILQALDVEVLEDWGGFYQQGRVAVDPGTCISSKFRTFIGTLNSFPSTTEISEFTYRSIAECSPDFISQSPDVQLLELIRKEYDLFQRIESVLCGKDIQAKLFKSVSEFIETALRLLNRRKSRAGRALENHFGQLLKNAGIPFEPRAAVRGRPDVIIPSREVYESDEQSGLFVVGVKTTCKDRWRQVLQEAPRVSQRYLLTLQQGISESQFLEMSEANVQLIVPSAFHNHYPKAVRAKLLTVSDFFHIVKVSLHVSTSTDGVSVQQSAELPKPQRKRGLR